MQNQAEKLKILTDILGDFYLTGVERLFACPKCQHDKRKLSINLQKSKFKCWHCDWRGNLNRLVKQLGNQTQRTVWKELTGQVDYDLGSVNEDMFSEHIEEEIIEPIELPTDFVSLVKNTYTSSDKAALKYLKSRGLTTRDIFQWKIGYCAKGDYKQRIIVPSFDCQGELNYFVGRTYVDSNYKYWNPKVPKNMIFNELYVDWKKEIVLVEGVFDQFVAGTNSIALLGSSLDEHNALFQRVAMSETRVIVGLDPDAEKKANRLISEMLKYGIEIYKMQIENKKDIGEMTKEEFLECKREAKPMSNDNYLLYLIERIK